MVPGAHDDVEIAGGSAHGPGVAATGKPDALPIARAGLDAHLQRLAVLDATLAVANRAHRAILAAAAAARARHVELHAATFLRDLSFAFALGAWPWALDVTLAVAVRADFEVWDCELHLSAAYGL